MIDYKTKKRKTYKRKTYKRKTKKRKTNKHKTYKRKTYKHGGVVTRVNIYKSPNPSIRKNSILQNVKLVKHPDSLLTPNEWTIQKNQQKIEELLQKHNILQRRLEQLRSGVVPISNTVRRPNATPRVYRFDNDNNENVKKPNK